MEPSVGGSLDEAATEDESTPADRYLPDRGSDAVVQVARGAAPLGGAQRKTAMVAGREWVVRIL